MEFREDGWYELSSNRHDYMGFELVADGFCASEPKRVFVYGPDGILVSDDGGDTFESFNDQGNIVTMATAKGQLSYIAKTGTSFDLVVSDLTEETETSIDLPSMNADNVPIELVMEADRLLLTTSDNSVYVFEDEGWTQLLKAGNVN